jgi:hypothetical protein
MTEIVPVSSTTIQLAPLPQNILPSVSQFITALGIPREVLASDEDIEYAWRDLPRELRSIPSINLHGELIIKMCVAVSVGLFDSAINYAWNAAILQLKEKIRNFGLPIVAQILQKDFDEKHLLDLQDSQLLELCLKLNLATEDGYFLLDQCRNTRNNFSAAHPTIGQLNDREFIIFLNRCVTYALAESTSPRGIDISSFISAVKTSRFVEGQCSLWLERIDATHDAQRDLLFSMIHGIFCDRTTVETVRLNIIELSLPYSEKFTSSIRSKLINQHESYRSKGDTYRVNVSQQFFEKIGLFNLLDNSEKHTIISKAVSQLWNVHQGWNNFYNEPPFAERLAELSKQDSLPTSIQEEFVEKVVGCYIGNEHGVSEMAKPFYEDMIRKFSPKEIQHMVEIPRKSSSIVAHRINMKSCRIRFIQALKLIDVSSVPDTVIVRYESLIGQRRSY